MRHALAVTTTIQNFLAADPRTSAMTDEARATLAAQIAAALIDRNPKINTVTIRSAIDAWLLRCAYL